MWSRTVAANSGISRTNRRGTGRGIASPGGTRRGLENAIATGTGTAENLVVAAEEEVEEMVVHPERVMDPEMVVDPEMVARKTETAAEEEARVWPTD
jgi:hypothetical protein